MKKKIALATLILAASLALTGCSFINDTLGSCSPTSQTADEQTTTAPSGDSETTTTTADETKDSNSGGEGGNPDIADYIEVTVSEDKYFYENHEISFDDLIKVLDELDKNTAVKISDDNATLKAYESLTKALEEREILIVEAD